MFLLLGIPPRQRENHVRHLTALVSDSGQTGLSLCSGSAQSVCVCVCVAVAECVCGGGGGLRIYYNYMAEHLTIDNKHGQWWDLPISQYYNGIR